MISLIDFNTMVRISMQSNGVGRKHSPRVTQTIYSGFGETIIAPTFKLVHWDCQPSKGKPQIPHILDPTLRQKYLGDATRPSTIFGPKTQEDTVMVEDYASTIEGRVETHPSRP